MKLIVCVKQVPDTGEIKFNPETNTIIRESMPAIVNPFDRNALEAAVRLKETCGGTVTVLSMGPEKAREAIRECISLGADNGVLITDKAFAGADTYSTSYILAGAIRSLGGFDLILCGKQAIDGDTGQVGPEIAEHLGIPQVTYAAKLQYSEGTLIVNKEHDEGYEVVEMKLPGLCTVVKSINEPRMPTIRSKMAANRAVIQVLTAADMVLDASKLGLKGSPTKVKRAFTPPKKESGVKLSGLDSNDAVEKLVGFLAGAELI
jgi:electron transfer flavoprotein alpha/beta subunit